MPPAPGASVFAKYKLQNIRKELILMFIFGEFSSYTK